jgi:hypothetical protein
MAGICIGRVDLFFDSLMRQMLHRSVRLVAREAVGHSTHARHGSGAAGLPPIADALVRFRERAVGAIAAMSNCNKVGVRDVLHSITVTRASRVVDTSGPSTLGGLAVYSVPQP